jgi:uronate dehydrogenase
MTRVLITGAAGHIGKVLRQGLRGRYELLRLTDVVPQEPAGAGEEVATVDIQDFAALRGAMAGIDVVVHLGGHPVENSWENLLAVNIDGTYKVFEAARQQGVKRVFFASTNHAIGFYRTTRRIDGEATPRPDSRYGVSKACGEAVARLYAHKYGLGVMVMRIGTCQERPREKRHLATWFSHGDMIQLVERGIAAPRLHYLVVYGVSNNPRAYWDNTAARQQIGFEPRDNAEDLAAELLARDEKPTVGALFHGGPFCTAEFAGDPAIID